MGLVRDARPGQAESRSRRPKCAVPDRRHFGPPSVIILSVRCGAVEELVEETDDKLFTNVKRGKGSPYSITQRTVPELIPVLGSQLAGDVSHKPDGRLPLLSARPVVTFAALKRAANSFAAW